MGKELDKLAYGDMANQRDVFERILSKLRGTKYGEPSFLNEIQMLLKIRVNSPYPVLIELTPDEKFWFEYIINLKPDIIKANFDIIPKNVRNVKNLKDDFTAEILSKFNTLEAVEYLRNKFILSERIDNTPKTQQAQTVRNRVGNSYGV